MLKNRHSDRKLPAFILGGTSLCFGMMAAAPGTFASEIITAEDFVKRTVVKDQLVKVSDNIVILFDTSSSMNDEFRDTGVSKLRTAMTELKNRVSYFPEIGHTYAIYEYTPWKAVYAPAVFNRDAVLSALDTLPEKGSGPTPLAHALRSAEDIIKGLPGRTTLFLFYDGDYTGGNPDPALWRLTHDYDVCLVIVSSAKERVYEKLRSNVEELNPCSRVIPFETFIDRPEYTTGLAFDVVATEQVVTVSQQKVVGLGVEDAVFNFDEEELTAEDKKA
ncbi:MAG: VWA domain-containing protein, partial [Oricola sp.]|nr:VWA domain-containing protein [Oricola sp.]